MTHKATHDVKRSDLLFFFLAFVARQSLQLLLFFFLLSLACRHWILELTRVDDGSMGRGMERRRRCKVEGEKRLPGDSSWERDRADPENRDLIPLRNERQG